MNALIALVITEGGFLEVLIHFLIIAGVAWVCWWGLGKAAPSEPFNWILRGALVIAIVLFVCDWMLDFIGKGFINW